MLFATLETLLERLNASTWQYGLWGDGEQYILAQTRALVSRSWNFVERSDIIMAP